MYKYFLLISFIFFAGINLLLAQEFSNKREVTEKHPINLENKYKLNEINIIPKSEKILLQDSLLAKRDYKIDYRKKIISLSDTLQYSLFDTLIISYQTINVPLKKSYFKRKLEIRYDDKLQDSIRVVKDELAPLSSEALFGKGIQRSGSISRGFSIGSNQDMKLNSGMRLQFSGKLSPDIEVVAALTDQNTPIQPEGTTERLEELDQVYITIKHPNATATFGDFQMQSSVGEFGRIKRKMQGLKGTGNYGTASGMGVLAGSKGKFNTNQFSGIDGNQGPYKLTGINNENLIIVLSGTEHVYIDGEEMKRGENNDYTIDYSLAEIRFTINRLITSASRITVDFEYTDRQYERNLLGGNATTTFFDNKLKLSVNVFSESDDKDNPIEIILTDSDKKILEEAGNDRLKAVKSGISLVAPDSSGKRIGTYVLRDTLISGEKYFYLIYNPGNDSAKYNAKFNYIGIDKGDYERVSIGNYRFVGKGEGEYMPVEFIPMPQKKQVGNFVLKATPWKNVILNAEFAGSIFDQNTFSEIDNDNNFGMAHNISAELRKTKFNFGGINLGEIGFLYRDRYVDDKFSSLDRFNSIEHNRDYNITDNQKMDETLREAKIVLQPIPELLTNINYGYLKRGTAFTSNRLFGDLLLSNKDNYSLKYDYDYVNTTTGLGNSEWLKQNGIASYSFGKITPGIEFLFDDRKEWDGGTDSLNSYSRKFIELGGFLNITKFHGINITTKYSRRDEFFPINGVLEKESFSDLQSLNVSYREIKEVNLSLGITLRNKKYTDKYKALGQLDNKSVLIRSQNRFNFWNRLVSGDLFYQASTESSAKLEKVFVRVQYGEGNYKYLGDLNNNGIADEDEFIQDIYEGDYILLNVPTSELFPVINLKTSTRWKVDFKKMFKSKRSLVAKIASPFYSETVLRLDEYSKETDINSVLLLNRDMLMNDSTTIRGANSFQQDIFLFKNKPDLSFRFRYVENNKLTQYNTGNELGYFAERSLRVKFRMVKEIRNQTDIINQSDFVTTVANNQRARLLHNSIITSDFSYRPIQNIEVGFKISISESIDNLPDIPTKIKSNSQLLRFTYSFTNKGRLRIEAERSEITDNGTDNFIPYEMLRGKVVGKNYFWRLNFDYKLANNLQLTINYLGRKQGVSKIVHNMRTEARAYF